MKSLMASVQRKSSGPTVKSDWEQDLKTAVILHEELPMTRMSRVVSPAVVVGNLPMLRDVPAASCPRLFIRKLRLCSYMFKFDDTPDSTAVQKDKEIKRTTLLELVSYLTVFKPVLSEPELVEIFSMLSFNIFRPFQRTVLEKHGMGYSPDEDDPLSEPSWPHLQVVYEFLLRLATSQETDQALLTKFFNQTFISNFLVLFDSEDNRERDYLKTILHRIYGNFMSLRPYIRRVINDTFFRFIYETDRHNGIPELLEILGSIINGFALPLKDQHKIMLKQVLVPLHKASFLSGFHPQLSYCVTQFLEKDPSLAPIIVFGVLKYWPMTSSKKELMFVSELEEILDRVQSVHLGPSLVPLFSRIAACINGGHFQISERSLNLINSDSIQKFVAPNKAIVMPILSKAFFCNSFNAPGRANAFKELQLEAMRENSQDWRSRPRKNVQRWQEMGHWNSTIVDLTTELLRQFTDLDPVVMDRCRKQYEQNIKLQVQEKKKKRTAWETLDNNCATSKGFDTSKAETIGKERMGLPQSYPGAHH